MSIRTILVVLEADTAVEVLLDGALEIAGTMESHLEVLLLQSDPEQLLADCAFTPLGSIPIEAVTAARDASATAIRDRFTAWRAARELPVDIVDHKLRTTYARWSNWQGPAEIGLLRRGRLADVIVMAGQPRRLGLSSALIDTALFDSGRPVLFLPDKPIGPPLGRVALAWNDSLQAVRCLACSMPFLHEAERVYVFSVGSADALPGRDRASIPAEDVAEALSWQGIKGTLVRLAPQADETVGARLLREVAELDVGLLALGAFTHSRVREALLGGVTRHVLDHATIPLLMIH
ncbi:universal stress protein [Lichenicoccus sp.]|uniref:universal stress protein n=1 Tax=Lichenicoccus sp. TaxID=2781899 RepID=UPI003D0AB62E